MVVEIRGENVRYARVLSHYSWESPYSEVDFPLHLLAVVLRIIMLVAIFEVHGFEIFTDINSVVDYCHKVVDHFHKSLRVLA